LLLPRRAPSWAESPGLLCLLCPCCHLYPLHLPPVIPMLLFSVSTLSVAPALLSHSLPHRAFHRLFHSKTFFFVLSLRLCSWSICSAPQPLTPSSPSQAAPLTRMGMALGANLIRLPFSRQFMPKCGIASAQAPQPGQTFERPPQRSHPATSPGTQTTQSWSAIVLAMWAVR
jgi:hypothetical protein